MEFYSSKNIKKTRKDHECFLCCLDIPKGESCFYEAGKWEGDFFSRHSHSECAEKWKYMNLDADEYWTSFDEMSVVYPHDRIDEWQMRISKVYNVSNGEEL